MTRKEQRGTNFPWQRGMIRKEQTGTNFPWQEINDKEEQRLKIYSTIFHV